MELLHKLCHWRLELDDVGDLVRVSPVETDIHGMIWWCGLRVTMDPPCDCPLLGRTVMATSTGSSMAHDSTERHPQGSLRGGQERGRRPQFGDEAVVPRPLLPKVMRQ